MTDKNILPENQNSKNTSDLLWHEAHELIKRNVRMESDRALLFSKSSKEFFREQLSTAEKAQRYVEDMWNQVQESSRYRGVTMSTETIAQIAREAQAGFAKQLGSIEQRRGQVYRFAIQEYNLSNEQEEALRVKIENMPNEQLRLHLLPLHRNRLVWSLCHERGEPAPLTIGVSQRLESLFGSQWNDLDARTRYAIMQAERNGQIGRAALADIWNQLDAGGRSTLLAICTTELTLSDLNRIDSTSFSQEALKRAARMDIEHHLSTEVLDLFESRRELDQFLDTLEWRDISDVSLSGDMILRLLSDGGAKLPRKLSNHLKDWISDHQEIRELERKRDQESEKQAESKESREGGPGFPTMNEAWVKSLPEAIYNHNHSTISGESLLINPEFLAGTKKLVLRLKTADGREAQWLLHADAVHAGKTGMFAAPIEADGEPNFGAREYVSATYFAQSIPESGTLLVETQADFYANRGQEIPSEVADISQISHHDIDEARMAEANDDGDDGEIRISTIDQMRIDAQNEDDPAPAAGGAGNGNNGEPPADQPTTQEEAPENGGRQNGPQNQSTGQSQQQSPERAESQPTIRTLEQFNAAASEHLKKTVSFEAGDSFSLHKPGNKDYQVFRITRITETGFFVWDGSSNNAGDEIDFETLYKHGVIKEDMNFQVIGNKLSSAYDFLMAMQEHSPRKEDWKNLEVAKDDDGNECFDFIDRRFDKHKSKKQYFVGDDGFIIEIFSIEDGRAELRFGEKYDDSKGEVKQWYANESLPIQHLIQYLSLHHCIPRNKPAREIPSREMPEAAKTSKGTIKAIFGRLSIHDLMSGAKKFKEELVHHLQHGNHLQEQRVMLMLAQKSGMNKWNSEWYADFKSLYENGEKKLIDERLETLGKMGSPDRQKAIRTSLLNNGTHDYDHWTNALSMLDKHGTLYAGALQDLEGTWIFFKRIAGIPLNANVNDYEEFQKVVGSIRKKGIDNVTEEAVIEEYMKTHKDFPNSLIWRMVKKSAKTGFDEEFKNGGNEVEAFFTLEQRLTYAIGKFASKEYAHGIGAMEKVFEKDGPAYKKHSIAFMLAMSRIPERLPRQYLDKFIKIYDDGRLHSPALMYIKDRQSQEHFRDTVADLVKIKAERLKAATGNSNNPNYQAPIQKDFAEMMKAVEENADLLNPKKTQDANGMPQFDTSMYDKVRKFWDTYGKELQTELTASPKGDIMVSKSVLEEHPALAAYKANLKRQLGDTDIMKEVDRGTPFMDGDAAAGVISLKPDKIIDKMKIIGHTNSFSQDNLERAIQQDFRSAMRVVAKSKSMSTEDKRAWFRDVYQEYLDKISGTSNLGALIAHHTTQPFNQLGLMPPPAADAAWLAQETKTAQMSEGTSLLNISEIEETIKQLKAEVAADSKLDNAIRAQLQDAKDQKKDAVTGQVLTKKEVGELEQKLAKTEEHKSEKTKELDVQGKKLLEERVYCSNIQKKLKELDALTGNYSAFDKTDPRHLRHFEFQFQVFLGVATNADIGVTGAQKRAVNRTREVIDEAGHTSVSAGTSESAYEPGTATGERDPFNW